MRQFLIDIRGVADQADGLRLLFILEFLDEGHGFFEIIHHPVHVTDVESALGAGRVHFDDQADALIHGDGQRLGPAHPAQTGRQAELALERSPTLKFG